MSSHWHKGMPSPNPLGRKLAPKSPQRTARNIIREHLRYERGTITHTLTRIWGVTYSGAEKLMRSEHPLVAARLQQFAEAMKLDEFDTNELYLAGARDAGYRIDPELLLRD